MHEIHLVRHADARAEGARTLPLSLAGVERDAARRRADRCPSRAPAAESTPPCAPPGTTRRTTGARKSAPASARVSSAGAMPSTRRENSGSTSRHMSLGVAQEALARRREVDEGDAAEQLERLDVVAEPQPFDDVALALKALAPQRRQLGRRPACRAPPRSRVARARRARSPTRWPRPGIAVAACRSRSRPPSLPTRSHARPARRAVASSAIRPASRAAARVERRSSLSSDAARNASRVSSSDVVAEDRRVLRVDRLQLGRLLLPGVGQIVFARDLLHEDLAVVAKPIERHRAHAARDAPR